MDTIKTTDQLAGREKKTPTYDVSDPSTVEMLWNRVKRLASRKISAHIAQHGARGGVTREDLEQEAYLAVYGAARTYREAVGYQWHTWYARYLDNALLKAAGIRSHDPIHRAVSLDVPAINECDSNELSSLDELIADPDVDVAEAAIRNVIGQDVRAAVAALPADQRDAITLTYLRGMSLRDAAEIMGMSYEWVRQLQRAGMQAMRKTLTERGYGHHDD